MKYQPVTPVRQRFSVRGYDGNARSLVQPRMRRREARVQSKTTYCHSAFIRRHVKVNEHRRATSSAKHLVKSHNAALAWDEFVTGFLAQFLENWIERRILKFL